MSDARTTPDPSPDQRASPPCRVLLVDDDPVLRSLIRRILDGRHYTLVETGSAEEASNAIRTSQQPFECVLCDVVLGGIDGYAFMAQLHGSVAAMILMSGYPADPVRLPPDVHFLPKPFTPRGLRDCIARSVHLEPGR